MLNCLAQGGLTEIPWKGEINYLSEDDLAIRARLEKIYLAKEAAKDDHQKGVKE